MKALLGRPFMDWRDKSPDVIAHYGGIGDETCGRFWVPVPFTDLKFCVIASCGGGWDHVSVSLVTRCPTWEEMSFIKHVFFEENEWAVEYHPTADKNLSLAPYCLHLWRPIVAYLPRPPAWMVAPANALSETPGAKMAR